MRFEREAYLFKDRALQGLQRLIAAGNFDYGTIATVLMLCFYDVCIVPAWLTWCSLIMESRQISYDCSASWITHLRGGLRLIDLIPSDTVESESLRSFFTIYFVAHDIMSRTASEDSGDDEPVRSWLGTDNLEEVCGHTSCSEDGTDMSSIR